MPGLSAKKPRRWRSGAHLKTSELAKAWGVLVASLIPIPAFEAFELAIRPLSVSHFRSTWFSRPPLGLRKVYGSRHTAVAYSIAGRQKTSETLRPPIGDSVGPFLGSAWVGRLAFSLTS